MPKVKLFNVKAKVDANGLVTIDHESKQPDPEKPEFSFDDKEISKYAQEVAEFNNIESTSISKMGEGEYKIDFKLIV